MNKLKAVETKLQIAPQEEQNNNNDDDDDGNESIIKKILKRLSGGAEIRFSRPADENADHIADEAIEDIEDESVWENLPTVSARIRKYAYWLKVIILTAIWCALTVMLMLNHEHEHELQLLTVPAEGAFADYTLPEDPLDQKIELTIVGPFARPINRHRRVIFLPAELQISIQKVHINGKGDIVSVEEISDTKRVQLLDPTSFDSAELLSHDIILTLNDAPISSSNIQYRAHFGTNTKTALPLQIIYKEKALPTTWSLVAAFLIVFGMYTFYMLDIVHRTLITLIFCCLSLAVLSVLHSRPSFSTIIVWIDFETLLLIFGMTIIVAIFGETGVIDYLAVRGYELANGHIWPLLNCMCAVTAIAGIFFNNIFMMLLMSPITIRLCEVMDLNPVPVLICLIIASNLSGTLTPIVDRTNEVISSKYFIEEYDITFFEFFVHVLPGVLLAMVQSYLHVRIQFHNSNKMRFKDSPEVLRLKRVIKVWKHTAQTINIISKDEKNVRDTLMAKVQTLRGRLRRLGKMPRPPENYEEMVKILRDQYPIHNMPLLVISSIVLLLVIGVFLVFPFPGLHYLALGWIALLGATLLLIIADIEDLEGILSRVEWSTLLYFACFFVLMNAVAKMGLMKYIADWLKELIVLTDAESRLPVAIISISWITAIATAFLSNYIVSMTVLNTIASLLEDENIDLPFLPLVWALIYGSCFGCNATIVSGINNVVCAGVTEHQGYNFGFLYFLKIGLPVMIGNMLVATFYLLIVHCAFQWR